jgi:hypothetical protein
MWRIIEATRFVWVKDPAWANAKLLASQSIPAMN